MCLFTNHKSSTSLGGNSLPSDISGTILRLRREAGEKEPGREAKSLKEVGWQILRCLQPPPPRHVLVHLLWSASRGQSWRNGRWELTLDEERVSRAEKTQASHGLNDDHRPPVSVLVVQVLIVSQQAFSMLSAAFSENNLPSSLISLSNLLHLLLQAKTYVFKS